MTAATDRARFSPDLMPLVVPIESVTRWPGNPRVHDLDNLRESLRKYGQPKAIVAQTSTRRIFAGNGIHEGAEAEGWESIAVTFKDWDDVTCRSFLADDNRSSERGSNDPQALARFLADLAKDGGSTVGYSARDLDRFLASLSGNGGKDAVPEVTRDTPWVGRGEVFALGDHRVMCGDATDPADLARLYGEARPGVLLTDPPYGIGLDTAWLKRQTTNRARPAKGSEAEKTFGKSRTYRPVEGDEAPFDATPLVNWFAGWREQFWFGAERYRRTLSDSDADGGWLVWDKRLDEAHDDVVGSGFELIWSRQHHQQRVLRHQWTNWTSHTNDDFRREHPTEKPVPLLVDILERWAPPGCTVADPFGGSGSSLVAAHRARRTALLMELDPAYVQVTLERWKGLTGEEAVRL